MEIKYPPSFKDSSNILTIVKCDEYINVYTKFSKYNFYHEYVYYDTDESFIIFGKTSKTYTYRIITEFEDEFSIIYDCISNDKPDKIYQQYDAIFSKIYNTDVYVIKFEPEKYKIIILGNNILNVTKSIKYCVSILLNSDNIYSKYLLDSFKRYLTMMINQNVINFKHKNLRIYDITEPGTLFPRISTTGIQDIEYCCSVIPDGELKLLSFTKEGIWVSDDTEFNLIDLDSPIELLDTVLICYEIEEENWIDISLKEKHKFVYMDTLILCGEQVNNDYIQRLQDFKSFQNESDEFYMIYNRTYRFINKDNFKNAINEIIISKNDSPFSTNGIMFIPINCLYSEKTIYIFTEKRNDINIELKNKSIYVADDKIVEKDASDIIINNELTPGKYVCRYTNDGYMFIKNDDIVLSNIKDIEDEWPLVYDNLKYDTFLDIDESYPILKNTLINDEMLNMENLAVDFKNILIVGPLMTNTFIYWSKFFDNIYLLQLDTYEMNESFKEIKNLHIIIVDSMDIDTIQAMFISLENIKIDCIVLPFSIYFNDTDILIQLSHMFNKCPFHITMFDMNKLARYINLFLRSEIQETYITRTTKYIVIIRNLLMIQVYDHTIGTEIHDRTKKLWININGYYNRVVDLVSNNVIYNYLQYNKYKLVNIKNSSLIYPNISDRILFDTIQTNMFKYDESVKLISNVGSNMLRITLPTTKILRVGEMKEIKIKSYNCIRIGTLSNANSCFIHAMLTACSQTYIESDFTQRQLIAERFRYELAYYLGCISGSKNAFENETNFEYIDRVFNNGTYKSIDINLKQIQYSLASAVFLGQEISIFFRYFKKVGLIALRYDDDTHQLYNFNIEQDILKRSVVVLINHRSHWETIGVLKDDGTVCTLFSNIDDKQFIENLYNMKTEIGYNL